MSSNGPRLEEESVNLGAQSQFNEQGNLQHLLTLEGLPKETLVHILDTAEQFVSVTSVQREEGNESALQTQQRSLRVPQLEDARVCVG
jgi:hypothetical protein